MTDDKKPRTPLSMRFDTELLAAIDERVADVNSHGDGPDLSRTEWMEKATRWCLRNLPYGATGPEVDKDKLRSAPLDVSGSYAIRMSAIEERRAREG